MSHDNMFELMVLAQCVALYVTLVAFPTGRSMSIVTIALTCLLVGVTLVFAVEKPNPRYVDFGPLYRSVNAGALAGFSLSAAIYHVLRNGKGHSWIFRFLGLPLGAALTVGILAVSAMLLGP